MIREHALAIAGHHARLVGRPTGVAHVYTGPLTPSGRFVPRSSRTVCSARTRQLRVLPLPECQSSLSQHAVASPRLCLRCTACLDRVRNRSRQATTSACSRTDWIREYSGTTRADVAFALEVATTPAEVDAAAWLSLLLFDVVGCHTGFVEHDRQWPSLHELVHQARTRVDGWPVDVARRAAQEAANSQTARETGIARRKAARAEREDLIARVGFNAAVPPRRPRRI